MKQAKSSICKFCGKEKKLIGAHIIPRKFYLNYESEHYQSIDPFEGKSKTQQAGAIDKNILCHKCDGNIIGEFDKEGYRVLLEEVPKHLVYRDIYQKIYHLRSTDFDYCKLRKFFISVLWRASISQLKEFQSINLGPYENKALDILKGDREHKTLFKILIFKDPPNDDTNYMLTIIQKKIGSYFIYNIVMAGYSILIFHNEKNIPINLKKFYKDYFMAEDNLRVIEDPIMADYKRKGFDKSKRKLYELGFKPKPPKNYRIT